MNHRIFERKLRFRAYLPGPCLVECHENPNHTTGWFSFFFFFFLGFPFQISKKEFGSGGRGRLFNQKAAARQMPDSQGKLKKKSQTKKKKLYPKTCGVIEGHKGDLGSLSVHPLWAASICAPRDGHTSLRQGGGKSPGHGVWLPLCLGVVVIR